MNVTNGNVSSFILDVNQCLTTPLGSFIHVYAQITSVGNSVTSIRLLWQLDSCFNKVFIYFLGNEKVSFLYLFTLSKQSINAAELSPRGVNVCIANSLNGTILVAQITGTLFSVFCN